MVDPILRMVDPNSKYLWDWIPSRGRSSGMISGVKVERFDVGRHKHGKFMLQLDMYDRQIDTKWTLLNVYGTPQEEEKEEFLCELASFCSVIKDPYILGGDFNILRYAHEKNKNFCQNRFTDLFNTIIHANKLRDIYMAGGKFTWSNNQAHHTLQKLDRILMSKEWESLFPTVTSYKNPRDISDHNPLILTTCANPPMRNIDFKFELSWLKQPEFLQNVERIWKEQTRDDNVLDRIQFKLRKIKQFFKGWGFNLAGARKKRKQEIQCELAKIELEEENGILNDQQRQQRCSLNAELFDILEDEELYWFRRCHETWLLKGDNNTKYFHRVANGQKRKKMYFFFKRW